MDFEGKPYSQIAYERYAKSVGNKSVAGAELPAWKDVTEKIQAAWSDAVQDVIRAYVDSEPR